MINPIIKELSEVDKWLSDEDKGSKWYKEYLDKVCLDLRKPYINLVESE